MSRLADHSCAPSKSSPALSQSPIISRTAEGEPISSPAPESEAITPSAAATTLPSSDAMSRSTSQQTVSTPTALEFNPQTDSLVPDDILDAYDDDDFGDETTSVPSAVSPFKPDIPTGLPSDVTGEDDEDPMEMKGPALQEPSPSARSDLPEDVEDVDPLTKLPPAATPRSPKPSRGDGQGGRVVKSTYGSLYDSDDEPNYEGGSVAIVSRTNASHKSSIDMGRTKTN